MGGTLGGVNCRGLRKRVPPISAIAGWRYYLFLNHKKVAGDIQREALNGSMWVRNVTTASRYTLGRLCLQSDQAAGVGAGVEGAEVLGGLADADRVDRDAVFLGQ
jgi:hypothetical protein